MKVLCSAQMGIGAVMGQTMRVVAIAKALQRRGHEVKFLAGGKLIPVIQEFGLAVVEMADIPQQDYPMDNQTEEQREELQARMQQVSEQITKLEEEAVQREKPDLLVCGTISGPQVGQRLGIPSVLAFLQPHGPKTVAMFTQRLKESKTKDRLSRSLAAAQLIILEGMPEISGGTAFESLGNITLQGKVHFSGPLLTESPDELPPREILKEKHGCASDKPLVYVTIGGGSSLIGEEFLRIVLESLRILPQVTGVIATGIAIIPEKIQAFSPPDNALIRGFAPGTELIKASDVTIFHGGSSTLMTCIACGTPAVVVPSMGEQEDNGDVLAQNGAGIVLDKQTLTPQLLAEAIQQILSDSGYRRQALQLKELGASYGGAAVAAALAEKVAREAHCP